MIRWRLAAFVLLVPATASAAPVLTSAAVGVTMTSPASCEVNLSLRIDGAAAVEHRLEAFDGSRVEITDMRGASAAAPPRAVGRTLALDLRLESPDYELRYRVTQASGREERCPLWLPAVPTTGALGGVRLDVQLPPGSEASMSMPALSWSGARGTGALAHVPAFVRVSYAPAGQASGWTLLTVMDALAIATFAMASGLWLWRRRRARWA